MNTDLTGVFEPMPEVIAAYLFGSQATGKAGPLSDTDIAVLLDREPESYLEYRLDLFGRLADALRSDNIDLVILNRTSLLLRDRVVRHGKVLYCRDQAARITFEARSILQNLDFQPHRDLYRRRMFEEIKAGHFIG